MHDCSANAGLISKPSPAANQPSEVLCLIFHYAIGDVGIQNLLPLLQVCSRWRSSGLGDSSLWTTVHLCDTTLPLVHKSLAHAGDQLLKVTVHNSLGVAGAEALRDLLHRIEEFNCHTLSLLASLGPAPNLKVLRLRDEVQDFGDNDDDRIRQLLRPRKLPKIFQGCLPSLRELHLAITAPSGWPVGLFKDLRSFELGVNVRCDISGIHVLDVLRESPLLENLRLVGDCVLPEDETPAVALASLRNCTLIGDGAISLIWYMDIPASTNVFLSTPPLTGDKTEIYPFSNLCAAPRLHVLDGVSTTSFLIGFDTVKFRAGNDSGGVLSIQVYYHENVITGLIAFANLFRDPFYGSTCGFRTMKDFAVHIERGAGRDDAESVAVATMFMKFLSTTPSLERAEFRGVPTKALSSVLRCLRGDTTIPSQNLQRLYIESTPIPSPKLLLQDLDNFLRARKELGSPLHFADVKVNCEALIPIVEHSAFLTVWRDLVEEDVRVEYLREKVAKFPRRGRRLVYFNGEVDGDEDDAVVSGGGSDLDWESWISGRWPRAASDTKETKESILVPNTQASTPPKLD